MNQTMIVTNVRMPQSDYRQIKAIAGELGMSVNEYMYKTVKNDAKKRHTKKTKKLKSFYDAMDELMHSVPTTGEPMGLSDEDEIIYAT